MHATEIVPKPILPQLAVRPHCHSRLPLWDMSAAAIVGGFGVSEKLDMKLDVFSQRSPN